VLSTEDDDDGDGDDDGDKVHYETGRNYSTDWYFSPRTQQYGKVFRSD
jgi:hypothetical protein